MEYIEITVRNFDALVKRKDIKSPQWFAMPNDILEHPDFFEISGDEFKAFTWIAGLAAKLNKPTVRVYPALCERRTTVPKNLVELTIEKLNGKRWDVTDPLQTRTDSERTRTATGQDSTEQNREEEGPLLLFKKGNFYKRLSLSVKEKIEMIYPAHFLEVEMLEIEAYLDGSGFRLQNKIDTFIPRSLKRAWLWQQENREKNKTVGGMVPEL